MLALVGKPMPSTKSTSFLNGSEESLPTGSTPISFISFSLSRLYPTSIPSPWLASGKPESTRIWPHCLPRSAPFPLHHFSEAFPVCFLSHSPGVPSRNGCLEQG